MTDQIKKNKNIRDDEEKIEGQEEKGTENTCISSLIVLSLYCFKKYFLILVLRSDIFIIWKFCLNIFWRLFQSNVHLFTIDLRLYLSV